MPRLAGESREAGQPQPRRPCARTVVFTMVAHWPKIKFACMEDSLAVRWKMVWKEGKHGPGSWWKQRDPRRDYCSSTSQSKLLSLMWVRVLDVCNDLLGNRVSTGNKVEGNVKNDPQFYYLVEWWAIYWDEKNWSENKIGGKLENSLCGCLVWNSYETSKKRCQMRKLDIQISTSEKDFGLEINIWWFSAFSWWVYIFVCTFILFANLNKLCLSMVLSSGGDRGHAVKGRCPQLSSS